MKFKIKYIIRFIFLLSLLQGVIASYLGFSKVIYICDACCLLLAVLCIVKKNGKKISRWIFIPIVAFTAVVIISAIVNSSFDIQMLWGIRNYYRFFIFFISLCYFFKEKDYEWALKIYEYSLVIHILLVLYQYFIEGYSGDYLGGLWGTAQGCNAGLFIYFIGLFCIKIYQYDRKRINIFNLLIYFAIMGINSALSELKFFFIMSILIVVVYVIVTTLKFSVRSIGVVLVMIIMIPLSVKLLTSVFPTYEDYFNLDSIQSHIVDSDTYSTKDDIGRSAVFVKLPLILEEWSGSKASQIVGIGLGKADYSESIAALNSSFYNRFGDLHYTWLLTAFLFIELGYLGIVAYYSIFVCALIKCIYEYRFRRNNIYLFGILIYSSFIAMTLYNNSLKYNYAYMAYFLMSIPFACSSDSIFFWRKKDKLQFRKMMRVELPKKKDRNNS